MTDWKENITLIIAGVTLVVAIVALIVAKRTLCVTKRSFEYAKQSDKQSLQNLIASKEAQLKSLERVMRGGLADSNAIMQDQMLKAEIEQLKLQLKNL